MIKGDSADYEEDGDHAFLYDKEVAARNRHFKKKKTLIFKN